MYGITTFIFAECEFRIKLYKHNYQFDVPTHRASDIKCSCHARVTISSTVIAVYE